MKTIESKIWTALFLIIAIAAVISAVTAAVIRGDMLVLGLIASIMATVSWNLWDDLRGKEDRRWER